MFPSAPSLGAVSDSRGTAAGRAEAPATGRAAAAGESKATSHAPPTGRSTATGHATAAGESTAALAAALARQLARAGGLSGAYVYDLTARTPLFAMRSDVPRPPASVEKLYTATAALELMGPAATLATSVLGVGHLGPQGNWEGDLYLHGGGDPTFGSASFVASRYGGRGATVSALAAQLVRAGLRSVSGSVYGDESYFDALRGEPSSGYLPDPELEGQLSALAFNRGQQGSERGPHAPAAYAARQLRAALRSDGVMVHGGGAASAPPGASLLAEEQSPTLSDLLGLTLPPSDNFFAETLLKYLGARFGGAGSTSTGTAVVRRAMARLGIHARVLDGSGLSHGDLTTPRQVVSLLADLAPTPLGTILRADMAVAGHSGTLSRRMRHTAAAGRCQGKTGTLIGVSNLAGYCSARDGHILAFAFFTDGIETLRAHAIQDAMTIALARY
jgi:D-alanyl-D-alanine carboxypeptidase/D-alanyl-D-alanine-endopeptidase (penicillin-binding protein 4)